MNYCSGVIIANSALSGKAVLINALTEESVSGLTFSELTFTIKKTSKPMLTLEK